MKTKTTAAVALAALTLPGAAVAEQPKEPGKQGRDNAAAQHERNGAKSKKAKKAKGKGFVVQGISASGLTVTDGKLAGQLTLDPTAANKHARVLLELTKTELAGTDTVTFGETGDAVLVKFDGLTATDALQATDVVKVIGKVTGGKIDIRKITVTRAEQPATETPQS